MADPNPAPSNAADRNLLFGILALQMDFIDGAALIAALHAWVLAKAKPLGQILIEQGKLTAKRHDLLEELVREHLHLYHEDPQKSLAALAVPPSGERSRSSWKRCWGEVQQQLAGLDDADVQQSLAQVRRPDAEDSHPTRPPENPAEDSHPTRYPDSSDVEKATWMRYRILRRHARGGLGEVYVAEDQELHREVAFKEIQGCYADDPHSRSRFVLEAEITGGLEHPGVVPVYGLGQYPDGSPFYAMRFIRGDNLQEAIRRFHGAEAASRAAGERRLALRQLLSRFVAVCNVIAYSHSRGVIHRDIKPGNIMLGPYGETLVVDWGLAKLIERPGGRGLSEERSLRPPSGSGIEATRMGEVVGTPAYMSPEQAEGRGDLVGPASDIYSLGATLYALLTGQVPFAGGDVGPLLEQVRRGEFAPPRQRKQDVPKALEAICLKAMAREPEARYATAKALAGDIEHWLADEPVSAHREGWAQRLARWTRRHAAWVQAAVVALLVVAAVAVGAAVIVDEARRDQVKAEQQKTKAEQEKAAESELRRKADQDRLTAELTQQQEQAKRRQAELKEQEAKARTWLQHATEARAQHFHQAEALYLAKALELSDDPALRSQWMEATQRSLIPVANSSRRVFAGWLAYSPDGQELASAEFSYGAIHLWRTSDWTQRLVLPGHLPPKESQGGGISAVRGIVFRLDRPTEIISAGLDGTIRAWDRHTGKELRKSSPEKNGPHPAFLALAIDPKVDSMGKRRLVTGDSAGQLAWWDVDRLQPLSGKVVAAHASSVNAVQYRPDGGQLASTGPDGVVRLWDPDGNRVAELVLPASEPNNPAMTFPAWGARTVTLAATPIGTGAFCTAAELLTGRPPSFPMSMFDLAYSPDGSHLASACFNGRIYVWDIANRKLIHRLEGHEAAPQTEVRAVRKLAYASPQRLFSCGVDGTVREWDLKAGTEVKHPECRHTQDVHGLQVVYGLALRPDGREIASSGRDCTIRIWDSQTAKPLARSEGGLLSPNRQMTFGRSPSAYSPEKHLLITSDEIATDSFLRAWDTRTLRERRTYTGIRVTDNLDILHRVSALAIRPNGDRVVSAEPNGDLLWWETESGRLLFTTRSAHKPLDGRQLIALAKRANPFGAPPNAQNLRLASRLAVAALAFSHDGHLVASAGIDRTLKLWDSQTGALKAEWKDEEPESPGSGREGAEKTLAAMAEAGRLLNELTDVARFRPYVLLFDREKGRLITAGRDPVIRQWDLGKTEVSRKLRGHAKRVCAVALSADGNLLASGSEDGFIVIWDWHAGVPKQTMSLKPLLKADLSRFPMEDERVVETNETQACLEYEGVRSLAFSPDNRWLAVTLGDGSVSLIDAVFGEVAYRGVGHETDSLGHSVVTVYFTKEGDLLTVGGDQTVRFWDLPAWSRGRRLLSFHASAASIPESRSVDGSGWVVLNPGGNVMQWVARTGRLQTEWSVNSDPASALDAGRPDAKVVLATNRGRALVLDLKTGKPVAEFRGPDKKRQLKNQAFPIFPPIAAVAAQPSGELAASSWEDGSVDLWRIADGEWVRTLPKGEGRTVSAMAFPSDGLQLAVAYNDGTLGIWDIETGKMKFPDLIGPRNAKGLCYSPDGQWLVQTGDQSIIAIWNARTGQRRRPTIKAHREVGLFPGSAMPSAVVHGAAYSPDGRWLATGGREGTVHLWDVEKGYQPVAVLSAAAVRLVLGNAAEVQRQLSGAGLMAPTAAAARSISVEGRAVERLKFTADSSQLIAVLMDSSMRVYDLDPILRRSQLDRNKLLAETEKSTGLRLQGDQAVPVEQNRLVREGETLRNSYEQDSFELFARWQVAVKHNAQARTLEARQLLESILQGPGVPEPVGEKARTTLATVYFQFGELSRARDQVDEVLRSHPDNVSARQVLALVCLAEARYAEALDQYQRILAEPGLSSPFRRSSQVLRLGVLIVTGQVDRAEKEVDELLHTQPDNPDLLRQKAQICRLKWQFPEAQSYLDKLKNLDLRPHVRKLAVLPLPAAQVDQQVRALEPTIRNQARIGFVNLYLSMGEPDKAEAEIKQVPASVPYSDAIQTARIELYRQQRRFDQAKRQFQENLRTTRLPVAVGEIRLLLAQVYLETGETDKAQAEIAQVLAVDKENPWALAIQAYLDAVQGKKLDQAKATMEKLVKDQPNNLSFQWTWGLVLAKQGQVAEGLTILEALAKNEVVARFPATFDDLGDVYHQAKRVNDARDAWTKALGLFPKTAEPTDHRKVSIEEKLRKLKAGEN